MPALRQQIYSEIQKRAAITEMKILLITSSFPRHDSIAGVFIPDTIRALNALGAKVHVLTQNCDGAQTITKSLWGGCDITYFGWKGGNIPLVELIRQRASGIFLVLQYLINGSVAGRRICRNWQPDIIFAEWLIPAGFIARIISVLSGIPYACRALGSDVYIAAANPLIRPLIKRIARKSILLFADGFDLCRKTSLLAGGKECFFAATARKLEIKKANSTFRPLPDENRFTFCCIGRLHKVKGQDILIKACALLLQRGISFRCYLVGAGEEKENLEKLIKSLSLEQNVILTGRLEDADVAGLISKIDCVVIPSRSESIPLVMSEGLSALKPFIVSNVGDMGFLAEKYNLGYVVQPEDQNELACALMKMNDFKLRSAFYNKQRYEELAAILSVEAGAGIIYDKIRGLNN
jgi:glycosyltransferase involved in cell wall biosynthesis